MEEPRYIGIINAFAIWMMTRACYFKYVIYYYTTYWRCPRIRLDNACQAEISYEAGRSIGTVPTPIYITFSLTYLPKHCLHDVPSNFFTRSYSVSYEFVQSGGIYRYLNI